MVYEPEVGPHCPMRLVVAVLKPDKWGRKRVVSGRGATSEIARSRCISEAIERQSAVYDETREIVYAAQRDLGGKAIDPVSLLLISDRQYAQAEAGNAQLSP